MKQLILSAKNMNTFSKYLLILIGLTALGFVLWYFSSIVIYILVAGVLSLVGRPVVDKLARVRIKKIKVPRWLAALVTLILLWTLVVSFFRVFIPLVANEANDLSMIDTQMVLEKLDRPVKTIERIYYDYYTAQEETQSFNDFINEKLTTVLKVSVVSDIFSFIFGLLGNIFIAIFAISFITFFFLKDQTMFANSLVLLVPAKHEQAIRKALTSTRKLLMRYFIGIGGQITAIMTLITVGMTIVGVGFSHALVIALVIGLLNVIPYVGPLIGGTIGILLGIATHLQMDFSTELLPLIGWMLVVILIVQACDNVLFQPLIFSSSVKAHPLEIFLVIMIAGTLLGIPGMIVAVPTYTVIRVFAKEFLSKIRVVQKLTENI